MIGAAGEAEPVLRQRPDIRTGGGTGPGSRPRRARSPAATCLTAPFRLAAHPLACARQAASGRGVHAGAEHSDLDCLAPDCHRYGVRAERRHCARSPWHTPSLSVTLMIDITRCSLPTRRGLPDQSVTARLRYPSTMRANVRPRWQILPDRTRAVCGMRVRTGQPCCGSLLRRCSDD